ncbi:MAG: carboxylesterase/lipase family protein [Pseudomonadales bacterium]|nr:carboxylesterase/lipase family protein [Pseudomonadales bacterium]MBO6701243.1 carboxylesterase/lipase family protein [Pseudomonadales bacterium]MBO7007104.1 carboxylesterase/lipase family protein [Pseudomonadales bacterium]
MSTAGVAAPVVQTQYGPVLGREKNGVMMFNGIPYAAPPTGDLRFKAPQAPETWDDIRDGTRFGPAAPQLPSGGMTNSVPVKWDEDCLFLNICTPSADGARRPVLVWIHGGAYRSGQGAVPWYNGSSFALNGDIVVVSVNYRLGALGFTDLSRFGEEFATSGANGTLDQIHALRWIKKNIEYFGGDPDRVTIAGESAGGFSVCTLVANEHAQGLFQRAVSQSGSAEQVLSAELGNRVADLLLDELGAENADDMMNAPVMDILEAMNRVDKRYSPSGIGNGAVQAFYPVVGSEVIPVAPLEAIKRGVGNAVVLMAGVNKDENSLFIPPGVTEEKLAKQAERMGSLSLIEDYREILPGASPTDLAVQIASDQLFRMPTIRMMEARAENRSAGWMYEFDWESRQPHLKATHALEIPFVFNTLEATGVDAFIGPGEFPQSVADDMHSVWTAFIQGSDPSWSEYNMQTRTVMHFDNTSSVVENGDVARIAAWNKVR